MKFRTRGLCKATIIHLCVLTGLTSPIYADSVTNLVCVADTGLRERNPDNNLGGLGFVPVGTTSSQLGGPTKNHGLFKFNLAGSLPPNATLTSVTLDLFVEGGFGGLNHNLHRLLKDWGEGTKTNGPVMDSGTNGAPADPGEATWNARFHPSTLWGVGGGQAGTDYVTAPSATVGGSNITNSFSSPAMMADVEAWLNDPGTNFGWILIIADESIPASARRIRSREDTNSPPVLKLQYRFLPFTPPTITAVKLINNSIQFQFNAEAGSTYAVESRGSLSSGSWSTLTNLPAPPVAQDIVITDPLSAGNKFYRVRTP